MSKVAVSLCMFVLGALATAPASGSDQVDADSVIQEEVESFAQGLRSESAREAVRQCASAVKVRVSTMAESTARREAVLFFCDMKAKQVLLAVLQLGEWSVRGFVCNNCLGVFEVEDIPALYDIAISLIPVSSVTGSTEVYRESLSQELAAATSRILRIEHVPLAAFSKKAIREWWLAAVKRAEKEREGKSGLEEIRRHFEQ